MISNSLYYETAQVFYQNTTCISNRSLIFRRYNLYLRDSRQVF